MEDIPKDELNKEQEIGLTEPSEVGADFEKEVQEISKAVSEVVAETSLAEKVDDLRLILENISEDVEAWRSSRKDSYLEALETLKSQVEEIQGEWSNVSTSMKSQRERLESLLESFPGIIETSTLRALSLRLTHVEKLVSELITESNAKATAQGSRKQLIISLAALGVTVILWGIFIGLNVMG